MLLWTGRYGAGTARSTFGSFGHSNPFVGRCFFLLVVPPTKKPTKKPTNFPYRPEWLCIERN